MTQHPPKAQKQSPIVSLVAAMAQNRVIGQKGRLPWHIPEDLRFFKNLTLGHTVIMGRKTFDTILRPLPRRRNIIVSRNPGLTIGGAEVVHGVDQALELTRGEPEVFIAGGQQIYQAALPLADRIYLTLVHAQFPGDAFFPPFEGPDWRLVESNPHPRGKDDTAAYTFLRYERLK